MADTKGLRGGLTRRSFLKASGIAVGAVGLAGAAGMASTSEWLAPARAHAEADERIAYTFHNRHCQCLCSHKCTVRDGRIASIEPNDRFDGEASICAKGISEVQHVYSADRIQTPLKRVGDRGSGEFVPITWDEALDEVASTIRDLNERHGKGSVLTIMAGEVRTTEYSFLQKVIGARGVSDGAMNEGIDIGIANGFDKAFGEMNYAQSTNMYSDWKNAKTIINVGCNLLETTLTHSANFFDALDAGAEIYTVDPHFSLTASKSTHWVPITPGTDAALYLGMIGKILDEGWYDEGYLKAHTSMPFLVDESTGEIYKGNAGPDEKGVAFVWDEAAQQPKRHDDPTAQPALEGTYLVEGRPMRTVFEALKEKQAAYPLSWAAQETGIPEDTLAKMTEAYATRGPQILSTGLGGSDKFSNADVVGHAQVILAALVGSIGADTGAGVGSYVLTWRRDKVNFGSWPLPDEFVATKSPKGVYDIRDDEEIHAVITGGNCLHDRMANMSKTEDWLNKLDLVVAIDMYHTPSTDYADIVLPACTRYESDEDIGMLHSSHHSVLLKEKVIDPLFESKTDFWIERELCKRFGAEEYLPKTAEELVRKQLASAKDARVAAVTVEDLLANNGVVSIPRKPTERRLYTDKVFKTDTGKLELYYEGLLDDDNALPTYEQPCEAYADNPARGKYPLQFAQVRTKLLTHCAFADATWIRQFADPAVFMNPKDAKERNIGADDKVRVYNDRGSFVCPVAVDESIRPGSVRIYEGWWTRHMDEGNMQYVTSDLRNVRGAAYGMYGPVIPFNDTLVEVEKA